MKRQAQLNNDARAVLLASQLTDSNNEKGYIREDGDVRRAQFIRGSNRLEEIGYVQKGTFLLTSEGERVALKLQENEARLIEGIPFDERAAAISLRGGRETANIIDEWQPCELDGQPAFTNGYILILGYPPSDNRLSKTFPPANIQKAWTAAGEDAASQVRPVAYSEQQGWKERKRTVWFSDGTCVDSDAFTFIMQRTPDATLTHEATPNADRYSQRKVLNFFVDGHRVAMLMPYQLDAPEGVSAILKSTEGEQQETAISAKQASARALQAAGRALYFSIKQRIDALESDYRFYLFKDELAGRVKAGGDMLAALWEKPEICLTWLLLCWKGLDKEIMVCTGKTRDHWLSLPTGEAQAVNEEDASATPPPELVSMPAFDGRNSVQLSLLEQAAL